MKAKLYKTEKENYVLVDPTKGTYDNGYMLGTSRESQYNKLSLKNCQTIERGYDLDELADEYGFRVPYDGTKDFYDLEAIKHYKSGFQKALELMSDKKCNVYDMKSIFEYGWNQRHYEIMDETELEGIKNRYIQSLQKTEWDVIVEMEDKIAIDGHTKIGLEPKLDADGCLILKRI